MTTASVLVLLLEQDFLDFVQQLLVNVDAFGSLVTNSDLLVATAS
jgi:hypothetical protein